MMELDSASVFRDSKTGAGLGQDILQSDRSYTFVCICTFAFHLNPASHMYNKSDMTNRKRSLNGNQIGLLLFQVDVLPILLASSAS